MAKLREVERKSQIKKQLFEGNEGKEKKRLILL